jgi:Dolichyl-phosphate-mannose-protein mannosyltransferase
MPSPLFARVRNQAKSWRSFPLFHPLTLLLLAFICNTALWAAVTSIGSPPDEFSHFDYICHMAITHTLPVYGETHYIHRPELLQAHASMPPLYYLLGTPLEMALRNSTITEQVLALRFLSVLLGAATVALVYMLGRVLAPTRTTFAIASAALVGFNPMFTYMSAAINSDSLVNLIYVALFLHLAYGLAREKPSRKWLVGLGALLGAGLITKPTIAMGVLASAVVLLFLAWRQSDRFLPTLMSYGFWVGSIATLMSGWYFVRNWILYGNPTGIVAGTRPDIYPTHPYRAVGSLWEMIFATKGFVPFLPGIFDGFWGVFDHYEIWMPRRVYLVMTSLLVGGLVGSILWGIRSWRHRHEPLTQRLLLLAIVGGLVLILTFAGLLDLSYRIDVQPQGRYLFAALAPLAIATVAGWEQLAGLLRLRWLVAPLIVAIVLIVNVMGLLNSLAPVHHYRYLGELLSSKNVAPGEGESYAQENRYIPKLAAARDAAVRPVYDSSPLQVSFIAQSTGIERLEMLINVPPGVRGPLIWRLSQQSTTGDLLSASIQPLAGLACYSMNVSGLRFTAGETYTLKFEAPAATVQQPVVTTVYGNGAADDTNTTDLGLRVVYRGVSTIGRLLRAGHLQPSDVPTSLRGRIQRLLYPLDLLLMVALATIALAPLLNGPWRIAAILAVLGLTLVILLPVWRAGGVSIATYEIASPIELSTIHSTAPTPVYQGFHDVADCRVIYGWAWDANQPNNLIDVDIYDGTTLLATISANVFRPDLLQAGVGNGYHSFTYPVDGLLKNGQPHLIRVKFAGTNIDLTNTPRTITCGDAGAQVK